MQRPAAAWIEFFLGFLIVQPVHGVSTIIEEMAANTPVQLFIDVSTALFVVGILPAVTGRHAES
jgi:hypothetical protein